MMRCQCCDPETHNQVYSGYYTNCGRLLCQVLWLAGCLFVLGGGGGGGGGGLRGGGGGADWEQQRGGEG